MSESSFKPAWWLPGAHLQTLWPTLCRRNAKKLISKRERVELPDGDFLDLNWVGKGKGPIVLILHGLEGSIESTYAHGMMHAVLDRGWRGLFMHFRGCSGEPNRLPRSYHSGETADVDFVMRMVLKREPNTPMGAIGFSLGGNVLLKWLGETGRTNPLTAAIAVSVPFELNKSATRIRKGLSYFYERHFLQCLRTRLMKKFAGQELPVDLSVLSKMKSLREFDDKFTAPLHGFSGVNEYYLLSSSRNYLSNIRVPTLLLQADDDPLMPPDVIPGPHELPEQVRLELTKGGGHVGFVSGHLPWKPRYWLEERVPQFLQAYLAVGRRLPDEELASEEGEGWLTSAP